MQTLQVANNTATPAAVVMMPQDQTPAGIMNSAYALGQTQVSAQDGVSAKTTYHIETDDVSTIQRVLQFAINNSGEGATAQLLRFGSIANAKDAYVNFGLTASASDDNKITDEIGLGCKKVQAFSKYVSHKPVITSQFKVICTDVNQLQEPLKYSALQIDGSQPLTQTLNLAFTQSLTDNRQNLVELQVSKVIDSTHYFEYRIGAGLKATVFIVIAGFSNNETFSKLAGVL